MSSLNILLNRLSDREFAFFIKYRFDEFTPETRKEIIEIQKSRNLSSGYLESLLQKRIKPIDGHCQRCSSSSFHTEIKTELIQREHGSYLVDTSSDRCIVCGYNPNVDKPLNKKIWLKKALGFYRSRKIK